MTVDPKPKRQEALAPTVDVERERYSLTLDARVIDWVNIHSRAGGMFRSHGDAVERAWARLRAEHDFIRERCRSTKRPFDAKAFAALYAAELEAAREPTGPRLRAFATVAVELRDWCLATWIKNPLADSLAQAAEVGLRRLMLGAHPVPEQGIMLTLAPEKFWRAYEASLTIR